MDKVHTEFGSRFGEVFVGRKLLMAFVMITGCHVIMHRTFLVD